MADPEISDLEPVAWLEDAFKRAFDLGASDIFITLTRKTGSEGATGQLRVDNAMVNIPSLLGSRSAEIVNKIKQDAGISTGSMIEPSEGRYKHARQFIDQSGKSDVENLLIRVTAYPIGDAGEFLSLRIPPTGPIRTLEQLGFHPVNHARLLECINKPGGLTTLAGPMGSGKTTTLYASVLHMGGADKSIITVEDPKERTLPGAHQLEIQPNTDDDGGMTYPRVLKSLLRVVMDVLLIGEVRDDVTAEAALRIATAGTRVLSSIHANDPVTAIHKIISYSGQSPINVLSGISGIAAQRMLRSVHHDCRGTGIDPTTQRQCPGCSGIGYRGKTAIHEILVNSQEITEAFFTGKSHTDITQMSRDAGMMTFHEAARPLLEKGVTDEKEIIAVLGYPVEDRKLKTTEVIPLAPSSAQPRKPEPAAPAPQVQRPAPAPAPAPAPVVSAPKVQRPSSPAPAPVVAPSAPLTSAPKVRLPAPAKPSS